MSKYISIIFTVVCHPAKAMAGFAASLDDAILPSLVSGIILLVLVQGGHYLTNKMWRAARYKLTVRHRQIKRRFTRHPQQ